MSNQPVIYEKPSQLVEAIAKELYELQESGIMFDIIKYQQVILAMLLDSNMMIVHRTEK